MYAYIIDGVVQAVGRLPQSARRLDTGQWVLGLADATVALREACGWYPVTDTTRPADTATVTYDRTVELVAGVPTVVWTERPKTQAEMDAEAEFAQQQAEQDALPVAARIAVAAQVRATALTDRDVTTIAPLFDPWAVGLTVEVGDVLRWDGTLVECIQAHTTQADWEPHLVPALWKIHRTDDGTGPIPWQPGISVVAGEQVTYDGVTYDVVQSHTTQTGWEPPSTPSLFTPAA